MLRYAQQVVYLLMGTPPPEGAPREERLRWLRRFYMRPLPITLAIWIWLWATTSSMGPHVVIGIMALVWVEGVVELQVQLRRAERVLARR